MTKKVGIYCPATRGNCDRPCVGAECQRVKLFGQPGAEDLPRPPAPDQKPVICAAQLRAARAYLGMTLKEFAQKTGVNQSTLGYIELEKVTSPQERTLRKIVGALYDMGIEVFGAKGRGTTRGIRDFLPIGKPKGRSHDNNREDATNRN